MLSLTLGFYGAECPQLAMVQFRHPLLQSSRFSIRGKIAAGANVNGTFNWTAGVKGLAVLLLKAADMAQRKGTVPDMVSITGQRGSYAASFDYALSKMPLWLIDMFGMDAKGTPLARRLFRRVNPEMKRPGPVTVLPHSSLIAPAIIAVEWEGKVVQSEIVLERMLALISSEESERPTLERAMFSAERHYPLREVA